MYKTSDIIKRDAKEALKGRWKEAIILNLIPILLRIFLVLAGFFFAWFARSTHYEGEWYTQITTNLVQPIVDFIFAIIIMGISFTLLDVVRNKEEATMEPSQAFRLFNSNDFIPIILINLLIMIFTFLWSLLLIIPGLVKGYAYSQSNFIYKDMSTHVDVKSMNATAFIDESRLLMDGHKGRLFWLDFSFIGWHILGGLTFGLAYIYITPYLTTCHAAFYDDLSKGKYLADGQQEQEIEKDDVWESF
ncbi:MAG: DUF975 family protein, partial [Vagococcus sp.]|uniref:DUF975 family protein n=1 Tax=Vagococcus sp. TaxID=1933889 RepID=UPI002FCACDBE